MAKKSKESRPRGVITSSTTFEMFCKEVYEGAIDGMLTIEISRKYGLSVAETYRWINVIADGKATYYPGLYSEEMGTVAQKNGRYLCYIEAPNMETGEFGHWWFYKNPDIDW